MALQTLADIGSLIWRQAITRHGQWWYRQLNPQERRQTITWANGDIVNWAFSEKLRWIKITQFLYMKMFLKCRLHNSDHFIQTPLCYFMYIRQVNSSRLGDAYMRQWSWPSLVQIMTCPQFGTKPQSEPMLTYFQWDPEEHISMRF